MSLPPARQALCAGALPRHRHAEGYVALVLSGAYEEAGDHGRRRARPGDVIAHSPFEAHLNRTPLAGAVVLNLPPVAGLSAFGRIADPDAVVRAFERNAAEAANILAAQFQPVNAGLADWPDLLAQALAGPRFALSEWAHAMGLSPEHVSRGFRKVYGVSPQRFGGEARNRAAWRALTEGTAPLAEVALAHGFADQAHLTRSLRAFTGRTPGAWRTSSAFKTAA